MEKRILVLGVGNLLLSDEGVGIHVVHRLQASPLPPDVEVVDGGTGGFELIRYFQGMRKVIIVDAVSGDAEPGAVLRLTHDALDITSRPTFSAHQAGIEGLLHFSRHLDPPPEIVVVCVVPEETHLLRMSLSESVERQIPRIISIIVEEICLTVASLRGEVVPRDRGTSLGIFTPADDAMHDS